MIYHIQTNPLINKMKNICIHQHDFGCMHSKTKMLLQFFFIFIMELKSNLRSLAYYPNSSPLNQTQTLFFTIHILSELISPI
jgi:hypothetical protein